MNKVEIFNKINTKIEQKAKKYKEQGYADTEFITTINNKEVKMILPKSVFDQQKLLTLASEVMTSNRSFDENIDLTNRYYKAICSYLYFDNIKVDAEVLGLGQLQNLALLYWEELLCPLSQWGDMLVADRI